jgi:carbonic anhydrase
MHKLVEGIQRFQTDIFESQRLLFQRLARHQAPEAMFVTCSDSRVLVSQITQAQPGDLFVLRNAGNLIPPHGQQGGGEAATLEYAVKVLGIRDIIVCGHSNCGAISALLRGTAREELPAVARWLQNAEPTRYIVEEKYADLDADARLNVAVQENVLVQIHHLRTHPPVAAALAQGRLHLHGWVFKIETGQVFAYDPERGSFELLREALTPLPQDRLLGARAPL